MYLMYAIFYLFFGFTLSSVMTWLLDDGSGDTHAVDFMLSVVFWPYYVSRLILAGFVAVFDLYQLDLPCIQAYVNWLANVHTNDVK